MKTKNDNKEYEEDDFYTELSSSTIKNIAGPHPVKIYFYEIDLLLNNCCGDPGDCNENCV